MMEIILMVTVVLAFVKLKALLVEPVMMAIKNVMVTPYKNVIVESGQMQQPAVVAALQFQAQMQHAIYAIALLVATESLIVGSNVTMGIQSVMMGAQILVQLKP